MSESRIPHEKRQDVQCNPKLTKYPEYFLRYFIHLVLPYTLLPMRLALFSTVLSLVAAGTLASLQPQTDTALSIAALPKPPCIPGMLGCSKLKSLQCIPGLIGCPKR